MSSISSAAKLYCPNPRKPEQGLHRKANGVWEKTETIHGRRKSFSSRDPVEVWRKRAAYIASAQEQAENEAADQALGPLFGEVADRYLEKVAGMKAGTAKVYQPAIRRARDRFAGRRMKEIQPWEIKAWLVELGFAHTTTSNHKAVVNAIYQLYIDSPQWHGDYNPARMVSMPRGLARSRRQPPAEDQVEIVRRAAQNPDPDALLAVLYLCTGERRGEACALTLGDIDWEKGQISVTKAVQWINNQPQLTMTKTEAGLRRLPLLDLLRTALEPYRQLPATTYLVGLGQKPVTASWYRRHWADFWRRHGYAHPVERHYTRMRGGKEQRYKQTDWIADVCAHQFRHEYVCLLAEAGVAEEVAIQMVGHANAKMIHEVYLHLNDRMLAAATAQLNRHLAQSRSAAGLQKDGANSSKTAQKQTEPLVHDAIYK